MSNKNASDPAAAQGKKSVMGLPVSQLPCAHGYFGAYIHPLRIATIEL
jgi:hypothetical protein